MCPPMSPLTSPASSSGVHRPIAMIAWAGVGAALLRGGRLLSAARRLDALRSGGQRECPPPPQKKRPGCAQPEARMPTARGPCVCADAHSPNSECPQPEARACVRPLIARVRACARARDAPPFPRRRLRPDWICGKGAPARPSAPSTRPTASTSTTRCMRLSSRRRPTGAAASRWECTSPTWAISSRRARRSITRRPSAARLSIWSTSASTWYDAHAHTHAHAGERGGRGALGRRPSMCPSA